MGATYNGRRALLRPLIGGATSNRGSKPRDADVAALYRCSQGLDRGWSLPCAVTTQVQGSCGCCCQEPLLAGWCSCCPAGIWASQAAEARTKKQDKGASPNCRAQHVRMLSHLRAASVCCLRGVERYAGAEAIADRTSNEKQHTCCCVQCWAVGVAVLRHP